MLNVFNIIDIEAKGLKKLDDIEKDKLKDAGIDYKLRMEGSDQIAYTLCKIAEDEGFDLIAIGRKGESVFNAWFYEAVGEKIFAAATCPVLVVPYLVTKMNFIKYFEIKTQFFSAFDYRGCYLCLEYGMLDLYTQQYLRN